MGKHVFGGEWTQEKLSRLEKYLKAYTTIFKSNRQARYFTTSYVDAFAGTGSRQVPEGRKTADTAMLFDLDDADARSFQQGSANIALNTEPGFDHYIFIEANRPFAGELETLKSRFPEKSIRVESRDANSYLQDWCRKTDWRRNRAVVFLDPYGMEVEWPTMAAIASTEAIDVWILFPLGQAVNRLLTKKHEPPKPWAERLTKFFGTEDWRNEFYKPSGQLSLLGDAEDVERNASFDSIGEFFLNRLDEIFEGVSRCPLWLRNSKDIPIYLLCFAAANPKGATTAIRIANDILLR